MKRFSAILAISMALFTISCGGNQQSKQEETQQTDTTATAVAPPPEPAPPAFSPFKAVVVQHKVKDFEKAREAYFRRDSLRQPFGVSHFVLGRLINDSNMIFVMNKIEDVEKAKEFFKQDGVKEAMKKGGVGSPPGLSFLEVIRFNEAPTQYTEGLSISHHVKDFDTWLAAYDAKRADREAHGMIDRGIARDLNDSNIVYLIYTISDLAKAKARLASPELKKEFADAGVDTPPTIRWFNEVER